MFKQIEKTEAVDTILSRIKSEVAFAERVRLVKFAEKPVWRNLNVNAVRDPLDLAVAISFNDLLASAFYVENETGSFIEVGIETAWEAFSKAFKS